jgi:DNA-binding transcriptional regulator YdaS (Cro superfamily)
MDENLTSEQAALRAAVAVVGGPVALGRMLGITSQAVSLWPRAPAARVLQIEKLTGVSRHRLRPDIFGRSARRA